MAENKKNTAARKRPKCPKIMKNTALRKRPKLICDVHVCPADVMVSWGRQVPIPAGVGCPWSRPDQGWHKRAASRAWLSRTLLHLIMSELADASPSQLSPWPGTPVPDYGGSFEPPPGPHPPPPRNRNPAPSATPCSPPSAPSLGSGRMAAPRPGGCSEARRGPHGRTMCLAPRVGFHTNSAFAAGNFAAGPMGFVWEIPRPL